MRATCPSRVPSHPATRVSIRLGIRDHARHGSLMVRLLQQARRAGLAGATAFAAAEGFGASGRIHRTRLVSPDAPVTLVIVDRPERISRFLAEAADLLEGVLVVVDDVDVVDHRPYPPAVRPR